MLDSGYANVIEQCTKRKIPIGIERVDDFAVRINESRSPVYFGLTDGETPRQARSALMAFMKNYGGYFRELSIALEEGSVMIDIRVGSDDSGMLIAALEAIYDGVKNQAEEAKIVLENAKRDL